jgi:hypothetical protein
VVAETALIARRDSEGRLDGAVHGCIVLLTCRGCRQPAPSPPS